MAHDNFKQSPIFIKALRAPDTMGAKAAIERQRDRDGVQVSWASVRLDHLIRNALNLYRGNLRPTVICAIKAFLRHLDRTLPTMDIPSAIRHDIQPKIAFCRELILASDREYGALGWELLTPEWFEEKIARYQSTMQDVVYGNPFYRYHAGSIDGRAVYIGRAHDANSLKFYCDMTNYWG